MTQAAVRLSRVEQQALMRQRILDAALGVFRQVGFAGSKIQDIAELAGCTRGSVYVHFGSREALLVAVLEEHLDEATRAFRARVDAATDVESLIRQLLEVKRKDGSAPPLSTGGVLRIVQSLMDDGEDDLVQRLRAINSAVEVELGHLFGRICALRGVVPSVSPTQLGSRLVALRDHALERQLLVPGEDAFDALMMSLELLLAGACKPASATPARKRSRS